MNQAIKDAARLGQHLLEEVVLEILFEARESGNGYVRAVDIARQADIYSKSHRPAYGNAITSGILAKLSEAGRIEQCTERGPWKLTEDEFAKMSAN